MTTSLKTLLIDDEKSCLDRLDRLLKHYCPKTIEVVGQCQTVDDAVQAIDRQRPDLVFLDVELGDRTGFDLLGEVPLIDFDVVFSTAHQSYAFQAFQADAVDYLLKPIDPDKLVKAVGKILARSPEDRTEHQHLLAQSVDNQERNIKRIGIPNVYGRRYIDVEDIVYCRSNGGYTEFYGPRIGPNQERLIDTASDSLKEFEKALTNSGFCRIHASHLINLAYLKTYTNGRGGEVLLTDGTRLMVSNQCKADFLQRTKAGI